MTSTTLRSDIHSRTFTLASRASQLAQIQTNIVFSAFQLLCPTSNDGLAAGPKFATSFMSTAGDQNQSQALYLQAGKSLWTKELEIELKQGNVDMIVHSLKDVPTTLPGGCSIGAILERENPVDSLIVKRGKKWKSLEDLPEGSAVGTSSIRRICQLKRKFPKLKFLDVRGNLNTRLAKLDAIDGPYAALILAKAGLLRLGMEHRVTADLPPPTLYHAVSQGALAVEIRANDLEALALCRRIAHWQTEWKCLAERSCLHVLEGGCSVPVGMASELVEHELGDRKAGTLTLTACVTSLDSKIHVERTVEAQVSSVEESEEVGRRLANFLIEAGARKILDDVAEDRKQRTSVMSEPDLKVHTFAT